MSLPFLKDNIKAAGSTGLIIKNRAPDESPEEQEDNPDAAMEACAHDLIAAIHDKDIKRVVQVLKDLEDCKPQIESEEQV